MQHATNGQTHGPISGRWIVPSTLLILIGPFFGIVGANLGIAGAWMLFFGLFPAYLLPPRPIPGWVWALGGYLAARVVAALLSPAVETSLEHLAKDWRWLVLWLAAFGVMRQIPPSARWLIPTAMLLHMLAGTIAAMVTDQPRYILSGSPAAMGELYLLALWLPFVLDWQRPALRRTVVGLAWAGIALSGHRPAWLALFGSVGCYAVARLSTRRLAAIGVLALWLAVVAMIAAGPWQPGFVAARIQALQHVWQAALELAQSTWHGIGPGRFEIAARDLVAEPALRAHAHNDWLAVWVESGLPALVALAALQLAWLSAVLRGPAATRAPALGLLAAFLTVGIFDVPLYDGEVAVLFFGLLGHALWCSRRSTDTVEPTSDTLDGGAP